MKDVFMYMDEYIMFVCCGAFFTMGIRVRRAVSNGTDSPGTDLYI